MSLQLLSQNVSGNYFAVEPKCKMHLKIGLQNNYVLSINNKTKLKGMLKILREGSVTYFDFGHISSVYALYTVYIQNSGNAMNPYWHFKECDIKYIRLAKQK